MSHPHYGLTRDAQLAMPRLADDLFATNEPLARLLWRIGQASVDDGLPLGDPADPSLKAGMALGLIELVIPAPSPSGRLVQVALPDGTVVEFFEVDSLEGAILPTNEY